MDPIIELEDRYCAHNYHPLPIVLVRGEGAYLWDNHGRPYLDMMSAYSAVSHGHQHPRLVLALIEQAKQLAVVSRAFHTEHLGALMQKLCSVTGMDRGLPMNTGAEAVETALKAARKWAYQVKGIARNKAEIVVCDGNFHGRTITIVGFSSEEQYREGFGPFAPGFISIPYGDADALAEAITDKTAAFLVEPIQGEAGIIVPPKGYLKRCEEICRRHQVLLICDEVQTGLGRTGRLLASEHEGVHPDAVILGKALGGGLLPVSAVLGRRELMDVFKPGDHGSTFGGNPLACAVALEALRVLEDEDLVARSSQLGGYFMEKLQRIDSPLIKDRRGMGLFIGVEFDSRKVSARTVCERLMAKGVLSKETHETVVRFAPPLIVTEEQIDFAVEMLKQVLAELNEER